MQPASLPGDVHSVAQRVIGSEYKRNPLAALLLPPHASFDEARAAYKRLILLLHPDKNANAPLAADAFAILSAAFNELCQRSEQAAEQPAPRGSNNRWSAFTGRADDGAGPSAPRVADAGGRRAPPDASGPPPAAAAAAGRWGRPAQEVHRLLKVSAPVQQPLADGGGPGNVLRSRTSGGSDPPAAERGGGGGATGDFHSSPGSQQRTKRGSSGEAPGAAVPTVAEAAEQQAASRWGGGGRGKLAELLRQPSQPAKPSKKNASAANKSDKRQRRAVLLDSSDEDGDGGAPAAGAAARGSGELSSVPRRPRRKSRMPTPISIRF
jgi:hypothetical protein